jgi:antitoxin PrlF
MSDTTTVTISSKGQLVLPRRIREAMGLAQGAKLTLRLKADGSLEVAPLRLRASSLFGLLAKPGEAALSLEDMEAAIEQSLDEDAAK